MILVNIGCGEVYHPDWLNLDSAPVGPDVRRWDARRPLPFADGSVDVVYHSHLLEHLDAASGRAFIRDCQRVLRPGGILRVAVPDLEMAARAYLAALEAARVGGDPTLSTWCRLELTDQLTRSRTGGELAAYAARLTPEQQAIVRTRAGAELDGMRRMGTARRVTATKLWRFARQRMVRSVAAILGGRSLAHAVDEGFFRARGEVHRVMYDAVSLAALLQECGFQAPRRVGASESAIPDFGRYRLDEVDGVVRKPDSLFMEATRP